MRNCDGEITQLNPYKEKTIKHEFAQENQYVTIKSSLEFLKS